MFYLIYLIESLLLVFLLIYLRVGSDIVRILKSYNIV